MRLIGFLVGVLLSMQVGAVSFSASIDQSKWDLEASKFSCRLSQQIPLFGEGVFDHEAGEKVRFTLKPLQGHGLKGKAQLLTEASPWQPGVAVKPIGDVKFKAENGFINVKSDYARQMLAVLYKGMQPTFLAPGWSGTNENIRIGLSAANFQPAYEAYTGCVATLLPVNYRQIARTAVLFPSAQWQLSDATKARLDLVAVYVNNDDSVTSVYVDGHSDGQGRRLANRDLSKKRAEAVSAYLTKKGINPDLITTRYHGERYPVTQKSNRATRERSRRVTIRLDRD
ncbi:MAG: OmpA family protein [Amphritea sp.]